MQRKENSHPRDENRHLLDKQGKLAFDPDCSFCVDEKNKD